MRINLPIMCTYLEQRLLRTIMLAVGIAVAGSAAQATPISYFADLSGPAESPPNASPGTGTALVTIDTAAHTLSVNVEFSGLTGTTTASHVHCCTAVPGADIAIVATETPFFSNFPIGVTSGTYTHLFDLTAATSWNSAFITASGGTIALAETNFATGLADGAAYLNVHTTTFRSGEIRGFLQPVPEPGTIALLATGIVALLARRRGSPAPA